MTGAGDVQWSICPAPPCLMGPALLLSPLQISDTKE